MDDAFRHINDQLVDDLALNRFVTAFLAVLDTASHRLTYHAGGQGPILHFHAARSEATLDGATTLPMGIMPTFRLAEPRVTTLAPGDIVAAITDGIYEYANPSGEMFGEERVVAVVREHAAASADEILHHIVDAVEAFASGAPQNDDMTLLIVKREKVEVKTGAKLGPYEIVAPLGAGGMGEVYRARDAKLNRDVALKILPDAFASDPDRMARFTREAQVLASLNHPNIAHIYGLEEVTRFVPEGPRSPTLEAEGQRSRRV